MSRESVPELVLGLSTATMTGSAALVGPTGLLASTTWDGRGGHAEEILRGIWRVLAEAGAMLEDVGAVSVCTGPGSFTGTRVALSTAKGLALAHDVEVVGVSSLTALADGRDAVCVLDARRGEAFVEVFRGGVGDGPRLLRVDQVHDVIASARLEVVGDLAEFVPVRREPSAEVIAAMGFSRWKAGATTDPATLEPQYLRDPDFG